MKINQVLVFTITFLFCNNFQTNGQANLGPGDENRTDFYLYAGYVSPLGKFGDEAIMEPIENDAKTIQSILEGNNSGSGAKGGFNFGIGSYLDLSGKSESKYRIGLNIDYLNLNFMFYTWENSGSIIMQHVDYAPYFNIAVRIGPSLQMNLSEKTRLNFHYQLSPTFSVGPQWTYNESSYDPNGYFGYAEMKSKTGFGFKHVVGVYLAFTKLRLGIDFDLGNINYNSVHFEYSYYSDDNIYENDIDYDGKTEAKALNSTLNLSLGFAF